MSSYDQLVGRKVIYLGSKRPDMKDYGHLVGKTLQVLSATTQCRDEQGIKVIEVLAKEPITGNSLSLILDGQVAGKPITYKEAKLIPKLDEDTQYSTVDILEGDFEEATPEQAEKFVKERFPKKVHSPELVTNISAEEVVVVDPTKNVELEDPAASVKSTGIVPVGFEQGLNLGLSGSTLTDFFTTEGAQAFTSFESSLQDESIDNLLEKTKFYDTVQEGLYLLEGGIYNYIRENGLYKKIKDKDGKTYDKWSVFVAKFSESLFKGKDQNMVFKKEQTYKLCREKGWSFKSIQDNKIKFTRLYAIHELRSYETDAELTKMLFDSSVTTKDIKEKAQAHREAYKNATPNKDVQLYKSVVLKFTEEDYPTFLNILNQIHFLSPEEQRIIASEDVITPETISKISKVELATAINNIMAGYVIMKADIGGPNGLKPEDLIALLNHMYEGKYNFKVTKSK